MRSIRTSTFWVIGLVVACQGGVDGTRFDGGSIDSGTDAGIDVGSPTVDAGVDAAIDAGPAGLAPPALVPGAQPEAPSIAVSLEPGESVVVRVEVLASEHVGFALFFDPARADVVMFVDRYDGVGESQLGLTDAGRGVRFLAVFEPDGQRTHWVRIEAGSDGIEGTLDIVHTPFVDGERCQEDCDRLLQLPLPRDPMEDGYTWVPSTVLRYWFGRRDLLMMVRHAGQTMTLLGYAPFEPGDLSQWDGQTPGIDTGSPRHASHQRGKDIDLTLYGDDGQAFWRSYCETFRPTSGRECRAGTASGLDGEANAIFYGAMLDSGRVTMSFLDRELIPIVADGAVAANASGFVSAAALPLFSDGRHLQHWPNHDNHIHVRVSEEPYDRMAISVAREVEPP